MKTAAGALALVALGLASVASLAADETLADEPYGVIGDLAADDPPEEAPDEASTEREANDGAAGAGEAGSDEGGSGGSGEGVEVAPDENAEPEGEGTPQE